MGDPADDVERELRARAERGDAAALASLLERWRPRLRAAVARRLDPRLRGRLDASDVVQSACGEAVRRLREFDGSLPLDRWVRLLARQEAAEAARRHLGAAARDVRREAPPPPRADDGVSEALVARLAAVAAGPFTEACRAEDRRRAVAAVDALAPRDREILVLRHFERLSNDDAARALGLAPAAAAKRHVRALARLRAAFDAGPDGGRPESSA